MTTHTQGPWDYSYGKTQGEGAGKRVFIGANISGGIGELYTDSVGWESNARLIAAAPDLLEAARHALETIEDYINGGKNLETAKVLRNAISKADGGK